METRDATESRGRESVQTRSERHRERTLDAVQNWELPVSLGDLADAVFDPEHHSDSGSPRRDEDAERGRILLHHVHLPKLDARGVIEYDEANRVVTAVAEH